MAQRYPVEAADAYLIWTGFRQLTVTIELSGKLELTRLRLAVTQIVDAYPILGSRLVEGWWRAYWEVMPAETAPDTVVVRSWDGLETTTWRWAGEPLTGPLQLLVGQGDRDLLIVKFDHGLGDFESLVQLLYLLADTYTRLESDPESRLPSPIEGERGFESYCRRLPTRERWRIFQSGLKLIAALSKTGAWRMPAQWEPTKPIHCIQIGHRFDRTAVERLEAYGRQRRATLFQVLLAGYFLALCEVLPDSDDRIRILVAVSLRRRFPNFVPAMISNQVGLEFVILQRRDNTALDAVLSEVQRHFLTRRTAPFGDGLTPLWRASQPPPLSWLNRLTPYSWRRALFKRQCDRELTTRERGHVAATTIGDLSPKRLTFGSVRTTHVVGSGHVHPAQRLYQMGVSGFDGTVTVNLGWAPEDEVEQLRRSLLKFLAPALAPDDLRLS